MRAKERTTAASRKQESPISHAKKRKRRAGHHMEITSFQSLELSTLAIYRREEKTPVKYVHRLVKVANVRGQDIEHRVRAFQSTLTALPTTLVSVISVQERKRLTHKFA